MRSTARPRGLALSVCDVPAASATVDTPAQRPRREREFLPEVQALRAAAVLLVVVYHLWPNRLSGGYVGVDVFFVISGFLITSHLHRDLVRRGTISLPHFYARRARRLLPAALLVLVATLVGTHLFLPSGRWVSTAKDVLASTFYVQNWFLATKAVEYSTSNDAASAVQHYWSLSVEEQFYLAWPSLILLLVLIARRLRLRSSRRLLLPGIAVVSLASLACSVYATATDRAAAYFVTPTRIWELGAGAMLALAMSSRPAETPVGTVARRVLRWLGLAVIAASAVLLTADSPFPGYLAALPVLGTVAVIAAGDTGRRDPLSPLINLPPTQFLGNVSYSIYLWHWPFIVILPFALAHPLTTKDKLLVLAVSIALAWLTKKLVEDSTQGLRVLVTKPALAAALTAVAMLAVSGAAGLQLRQVSHMEATARADLARIQGGPCFGAGAIGNGNRCADPFGHPVSVALTPEDAPWFIDPACTPPAGGDLGADCRFSSGTPSRRVALVGDSHAEHWRGALHRIAKQLNWEIVEYLKGGCPETEARVLRIYASSIDTDACRSWGQSVDQRLAAEHFDYIITSSYASAYTFDSPDGDSLTAGEAGFLRTWRTWADGGARVFVLRDIPTPNGRSMPECLTTHPGSPLDCSLPRAGAMTPEAATLAAGRVHDFRIQFVDMTHFFCDADSCYSVIGGANTYWDKDHMSAQFSRSLAPFLLDAMQSGLH